jgi:hypothetical protein
MPPRNPFDPKYPGVPMHLPGENAFAISPHDTNDLPFETRGLWVGSTGDITVDMAGIGTAITFAGVVAGSLLPLRVTRVYATATTAGDIVGVY